MGNWFAVDNNQNKHIDYHGDDNSLYLDVTWNNCLSLFDVLGVKREFYDTGLHLSFYAPSAEGRFFDSLLKKNKYTSCCIRISAMMRNVWLPGTFLFEYMVSY